MKIEKLRELSDTELVARIEEGRRELLNLRLQKSTGQLSKPHLFRRQKTDIARCLTLLSERKSA